MLHGDVTSKASSSAFNRHSFDVNMLGGHALHALGLAMGHGVHPGRD